MMAMIFDTVNKVVDEMIVEEGEDEQSAALIPQGVMENMIGLRKKLLKPDEQPE